MGPLEQPKKPGRAVPDSKSAPAGSGHKPPDEAARKKTEQSAMVEGLSDAARSLAGSAFLDKRPYLKLAFQNPYNISLFAGLLAAAGLTLNPLLAIAAFSLEGLWLLHAPESKRLPPDGQYARTIVDRVKLAGTGIIESLTQEKRRLPPPLGRAGRRARESAPPCG